ncbi:signal transduction histidine kinase/DNA-binding response OmpR family regulator/DNA-binding LacI/PurR family transcriptional regulator [Parabacteroides sp. PF5-5]|uniref:hybrid sensor histidine kinase/response regulator transcription factor n=1 Tax=unclassified Parabacteroides TaxID=2649774 RepID=UPI0024737F88|nr:MULTISPECIES: substrate-binding domain-containing protein [unclassified Parabacteroides]MDH6306773.1 signal transduction histidine kinase/DNA-binding response OmpR family regulator/DNA-binding LacI/PurR family transcriptional regulator [Parabacteroides sp. PH5-39]MDH6317659.1 signal transduction histidine kinase/DNA-binding response OmpR family regulator/DNA-binding LacI/PurR family transcriptional regulator [Parabacteroides sp. PF5-13]MDH6321485.1 signal transduction histidine kinase/DNA-bin
MRNLKAFIIIPLLSLLLCGCNSIKEEKKYVVGLSQCMLDDAWRQSMIRETQLEASNYDNLELVIRNADSDNEQQIAQIQELIDMGVDALIISPNQSDSLTPIAEKAYKAGIPTIITDRKVNTELYTTFIGANNYEIGVTAGEYALQYLPEKAVVLEIWGLESSSPAQERHQGFAKALEGRTDISFIKLEGEWRYDTTRVRVARMDMPERIDFVYAHNDMMAIAARELFNEQDPLRSETLPIIGVDAVPGAGLEAVSDGRINASFMYPTGGEQVIQAAMDILNGKPIDKYIPLESAQVDRPTARTLLIQYKTILNYQGRIENQRGNIDQLLNRFRFLENSLLLISSFTFVFICLIIYIFYINRKVRKRNKELREMNIKEREQQQRLIALNTEIKEVTAQRLQFFTNVSHELRTPLTLILGPLNKLISLMGSSPYLPDLQLMQKNANRLLREINLILDFRKLENSKEKVNIHQADLVAFTGEVKTSFDSMASARQIHYTFHADMKTAAVWFDPDLMEKLLANLLSNAFKFTPEKGAIEVAMSENETQVFILVKDSGRGIQAEKVPYLFDRFYTEDSPSGTGIGLHLVQQYVRMHHGDITVDSKPGAGTTFTITLLKGKAHFDDDISEVQESSLSYEASQLDDTEEKALLTKQYPYTILAVEDDAEVLAYLSQELKENFSVLTATNGKEALTLLETEDISLVLSDVMMPEMNGFDLCRTMKREVSLNHIPVVLLTALSEERQKNFAISGGADDYIQKPFDTRFVKLKIIRLLEERKRLREQLLSKLQNSNLLQTDPGKVENMDDLFLRKLLERIEEVYTDPEFNIEKLSDSLSMSRGHLHRKVKDLTGTTPVDFLRNYRLRKAAVLLKQQQLSISEIAYHTGFSSPAYFSKCFKTLYDKTPKEYQEHP